MPHLLGAVARGQIETFKNKMLIKKIFVGKTYRKISKKNKILMTQSIPKNFKPVFWLNSIYFKDLKKKQVNKIGEYLMKKGIEVRSGFWPLNKQKGFKFKYINGVNQNSKNLSNKIFEKSLVLPSSIDLREKDIDYILKTVKNLL